MNYTKNLFRFVVGKVILSAVLFCALGLAAVSSFAQTADVRYAGVFYVNGSDFLSPTVNNMYCDYGTGSALTTMMGNSTNERSFVYGPTPSSLNPSGNQNPTDPWVSSALIEYDQPYPNSTPSSNSYPNHCLALCMKVKCSNKPLGGSTYSISFPLQNVKFDVVKYYNNKNVENAEETPAVRTIDLYPTEGDARCGSYRCPGKNDSGVTCNSAQYYCTFVTGESSGGGSCASANCYGTVMCCPCPRTNCNRFFALGPCAMSQGNSFLGKSSRVVPHSNGMLFGCLCAISYSNGVLGSCL